MRYRTARLYGESRNHSGTCRVHQRRPPPDFNSYLRPHRTGDCMDTKTIDEALQDANAVQYGEFELA